MMRARWAVVLGVGLFLAVYQVRADGGTRTAQLRGIWGTAWVVTPSSGGSSALIDGPRRLVLTNYHVVKEQRTVEVVFPAYRANRLVVDRAWYWKEWKSMAVPGRVLGRDRKRDLALIEVDRLPKNVRPLAYATRSARVGDTVLRIGSPSAEGEVWKATPGKVERVGPWRNTYPGGHVVECKMITTAVVGRGGDSGGPVLDLAGNLVGLHAAGHDDRPHSLAIEMDEVKAFVREALAVARR